MMYVFISLECIPRSGFAVLCNISLKTDNEVGKLLATNIHVHITSTYFIIRVWYFLVDLYTFIYWFI